MMQHFRARLRNRWHRAKLRFRTDQNIHYALYGATILIVILLGVLLAFSNSHKKKDFVSYELKKCFNKSIEPGSSASAITFTPYSKKIIVEYRFRQVCYADADIEPVKREGRIDLYFVVNSLKAGCYCDSVFTAELGPLEPREYNISLYKKAAGSEYLVKNSAITIK